MAYYSSVTGKYEIGLPEPEIDESNPNQTFKRKKRVNSSNMVDDDKELVVLEEGSVVMENPAAAELLAAQIGTEWHATTENSPLQEVGREPEDGSDWKKWLNVE